MRWIFRLSAGFCLAGIVAGCSDNRRKAVRTHVESAVPENMRLLSFDEQYQFQDAEGGHSLAQVVARYETLRPTVREMDAMSLPEAAELRRRVAEVRDWAIARIPEEDGTRKAILSAAAEVMRPFPVKRVVTPAGSKIDGVLEMELAVDGAEWRVERSSNSAFASGEPDRKPELPFEGTAEVRARFAELGVLAGEVERMRARFVERREKNAAQSLAALSKSVVTGRTFNGMAKAAGGGEIPIRLVISRGLDLGDTVVSSLTTETLPQRAAQFTGKLRQRPSGEYFLEAVRSRVLSGRNQFPNSGRGKLQLFRHGEEMDGVFLSDSGSSSQITLKEGGRVDLLPEAEESAE